MCVTRNEPLCSRVSSFYYYFIMQSSWRSLEINIFISFRVIMLYFYFAFKMPLEIYSILQSLHLLFHPFSKSVGYCCATSPEKEALQTNLKCTGSSVHSCDHARCNHFSYPELGKDLLINPWADSLCSKSNKCKYTWVCSVVQPESIIQAAQRQLSIYVQASTIFIYRGLFSKLCSTLNWDCIIWLKSSFSLGFYQSQ